MTVGTGKKLYFLYCFLLGLAYDPIANAVIILLSVLSTDNEKISKVAVIGFLFIILAATSPLRVKGFRQIFSQHWPQMVIGMPVCIVIGIIAMESVAWPLIDLWLARIKNPHTWFLVLITGPAIGTVLSFDIYLAKAFEKELES